MPEVTEAMAFTVSYKHMECLGGMRSGDEVTEFSD